MTDCQHHYVIDTPAGTYSAGRCKHCGALREFCNVDPSLLERSWNGSLGAKLADQRRRGLRQEVGAVTTTELPVACTCPGWGPLVRVDGGECESCGHVFSEGTRCLSCNGNARVPFPNLVPADRLKEKSITCNRCGSHDLRHYTLPTEAQP